MLVDKFVHDDDEETQECACQTLYELATSLQCQPPSPIIQRLESEKLVNQLFDYIITTVSHKTHTHPPSKPLL